LKKISFITTKCYHKNLLFRNRDYSSEIGNYDKYIKLHELFRENGYFLATNDINRPEESDLLLYFDMPSKNPDLKYYDKSFLLALESPLAKPRNLDKKLHKYFKKIFTWNDDHVDNNKYIKINYSFNFQNRVKQAIPKQKFSCLIVSNKHSSHPNELYSQRRKLINWFNLNYVHKFDLYGYGWGAFKFRGNKYIRLLNYVPFLNDIWYELFGKKYKAYKGTVSNKYEIMSKYKFAFSYENISGYNGYITEKIFDPFLAGTVPIYLGSENILDYIPNNTFIDIRNFKDFDHLYNYLTNLNQLEYEEYLHNINNFLKSKDALRFSSDTFAKTIVENCLSDEYHL